MWRPNLCFAFLLLLLNTKWRADTMTYSYFPPGCLLQVNPAPLRAVLLHHLLRAALSGGLARVFAGDWHLYRKRNTFPSGFFPFPFRNLQVLIFLLARLFRQRWCSLTVGGAVRVQAPARGSWGARLGGRSAVRSRHVVQRLCAQMRLPIYLPEERALYISQGYCEMWWITVWKTPWVPWMLRIHANF